MTVTPSGIPARRRLGARAVAGVGAALLAVTLLAPGAASAATPTPTPTPTPDVPPGTTVFTLSPVGSGIVGEGDGLTASVTLQNGTALTTAPADVTLSLGSTPITDRRTLSAWLDGTETDLRTRAVATTTIGAVEPGGESSHGMLVPSDARVLEDRDPGVYPLVASYDDADGEVRSTSVMIVPEDDDSVASIAVIVPITASPRSAGLLTADELTSLTAPGGALTNQLEAVDGTPAILAVDPAIVAAIRVLGTSAPETAQEWLAQLLALPNARFALQFGDADAAVQLQTGLERPLAPRSLSAYMSADDFAEPVPAAEEPTPTPTAGSDDSAAEASPFPDLDALLDIGEASPLVYWPDSTAVNPEVIEALGDITVDETTATTVIASDATRAGAAGATVGARARVGDSDVVVYDSAASTALHAASLQASPAMRGADLTAATAHVTLASKDARGSALLVTVDRAADRSNVALRTAILAATSVPGLTEASLDDLVDASPRRTQVGDGEASAGRVASASALLEEESEIGRFATVLDDASLLTGPERAEILQLLGVAWLDDDEGWDAAIDAHRTQSATTLDSVSILPSSTINLFGSGAGLGFWVRNDLPYPVNLILYATPDDLRLDVQRANQVVATAASNTRVEVPVQARVANGDVEIALQLRSRASVAIGDPETVQVNVRAEWETVGVTALAIVVGGLLLIGVVRTVKRVRSRRAAPDDEAPHDATEDSTDHPADDDSAQTS